MSVLLTWVHIQSGNDVDMGTYSNWKWFWWGLAGTSHQTHISSCYFMYSQSHLGWHFRMLFQSSKLKASTSLFTETWQKRRSSFELWALKMSPHLGLAVLGIWCFLWCYFIWIHVDVHISFLICVYFIVIFFDRHRRKHAQTTPTHVNRQTEKEGAWGDQDYCKRF